MNIAIIGATGLLGKPVTQQLIDAGFTVTILARHPEQAQALFPNTRVVKADLRDPASLAAGLQNQDALYLSLSVLQGEKQSEFHTETNGLDNLLPAAQRAGIRRIGYLSSIVMRYQGMNGFRWWVFDVKHEAVRRLKASGIPHLIFYPSTFMETFFLQLQGNRLALAGSSEVRLWMIAGRDYGRQVAAAFQKISLGESREYVVQGPEAHTLEAGARLFAKHYQKQKLSVLKAPLTLLKIIGLASRKVNYGAHILEALHQYPERFEAATTWAELGSPITTVPEFARTA
ncbi:MAG: NAD(P)H-binding protein [Cytophagaceae bacterium]|nr:NAD(P)H-binding protein [Cytophagaceae bacterium]